jgi:FkbM family methyltransferase
VEDWNRQTGLKARTLHFDRRIREGRSGLITGSWDSWIESIEMPLKRVASLLPPLIQHEFRRWKIWVDLKRGLFSTQVPEFQLLQRLIDPGDWVLDIGANVGYYTMRLSELVGREGRVFAFEPIGATSEILGFISRFAPYENVTIFNTAVSDKPEILKFSISKNEHGLPDYFTARATEGGNHAVFATTIDALAFPRRVSFVKIDTEGAESAVLRGMDALIERDHPVLAIEGDESLEPYLAAYGYHMRPRQPGSANLLFLPTGFSTQLA